jgi:AAA domain
MSTPPPNCSAKHFRRFPIVCPTLSPRDSPSSPASRRSERAGSLSISALQLEPGDSAWVSANRYKATCSMPPWRITNGGCKGASTGCCHRLSAQWPEGLTLANSWRRLDKGGVNDVRQWIEQTNNPRLVVLDTLASVKPIRTQQGYTEDYESLAALHRLANETAVSIILLHHTRKMEAEDPVDTVSGTLGLAGCADSVLVLARSSQGTTLYVRGRDVEEAEHAVSFDKHSCKWTILGNASEVHRSNQRGKILDVLLNATELLGPQQIADDAQMKSDNVRYLLGQMVRAGEVMKAARGRYYHPERNELSDTP